jgi:hypothetical protein
LVPKHIRPEIFWSWEEKEKHLIIQYELAIIIPQVDTVDTVDTFGKYKGFPIKDARREIERVQIDATPISFSLIFRNASA